MRNGVRGKWGGERERGKRVGKNTTSVGLSTRNCDSVLWRVYFGYFYLLVCDNAQYMHVSLSQVVFTTTVEIILGFSVLRV